MGENVGEQPQVLHRVSPGGLVAGQEPVNTKGRKFADEQDDKANDGQPQNAGRIHLELDGSLFQSQNRLHL